jgi:tetratricopeptide (TPR) repeat protein
MDPMDASDEMLYKMAAVNLARRNVAIDAGLAAAEGSEQSHENALEQLVASVQDDEASLVLLLYRLGVRHINGGRYDDARECLSSVLDMDSSHSRARDALATAMFNAGVTALNDGASIIPPFTRQRSENASRQAERGGGDVRVCSRIRAGPPGRAPRCGSRWTAGREEGGGARAAKRAR